MEKYERVILKKEYGKLKVGETYEIANITDEFCVIRDGKTRVAVSVVPTESMYEYFEANCTGWTDWIGIIITDKLDGKSFLEGFYRTNQKKVQVKICQKGKYFKAEANCNLKYDTFNLKKGIDLAYIRCMKKIYIDAYTNALNNLNEILKMEHDILKMIK